MRVTLRKEEFISPQVSGIS